MTRVGETRERADSMERPLPNTTYQLVAVARAQSLNPSARAADRAMLRGRWRRQTRYRRWHWRRYLRERLVGVALWSIDHCVAHYVAPVRRLEQRKLRCFSGGEHCGKLEPPKSLHCAQVLYCTSVMVGESKNKTSARYGPQWSGRAQYADGRTSSLVPTNERHHTFFFAH